MVVEYLNETSQEAEDNGRLLTESCCGDHAIPLMIIPPSVRRVRRPEREPPRSNGPKSFSSSTAILPATRSFPPGGIWSCRDLITLNGLGKGKEGRVCASDADTSICGTRGKSRNFRTTKWPLGVMEKNVDVSTPINMKRCRSQNTEKRTIRFVMHTDAMSMTIKVPLTNHDEPRARRCKLVVCIFKYR